MKTLKSICITIVLFTITSNAQITKGNWMVGGSGSISSSSYESTSSNSVNKGKSSGIQISPTLGYFLADKFAAGLSGGFGFGTVENGSSGTSYTVGPFVRYYFLKPEKTVNIFAQIGTLFGGGSTDSKFSNYSFKAGPVIYFNSSVGMEVTLNYDIQRNLSTFSDTTFKTLNIGIGFQIHLEK